MCVRRTASETMGAGPTGECREAVLRYGLDRQDRAGGRGESPRERVQKRYRLGARLQGSHCACPCLGVRRGWLAPAAEQHERAGACVHAFVRADRW